MRNNWNGRFLYYFGGLILALFFVAGLIHTVTGNATGAGEEQKVQENKKASADKKSSEKMESKTETEDSIRVLLKTNGFSDEVHAQITVSAKEGLVLTGGKETKKINAGESASIRPDDAMFQNGTIRVAPAADGDKIVVESLKRGYGTPSYRGTMELYKTAQGIAVVNELSLEEYLYGVVPSEMPASYEMEALKTQAVCARSYAYCHLQGEAYPQYRANVDDSTAYQVYGNSKEQEKTIQAVDATKGEYLTFNGKPVKAYYFSTSCGHTTNVEAWGTTVGKENQYLKGSEISENGECYEKALPWFSWSCDIPQTVLSNLFGLNTGKDVGMIQNIEITKRGEGNIALEMKVTGTKGEHTVKTENKIRSALGGSGYEITRQDGFKAAGSRLLPSAFFEITRQNDVFHIEGGGYGHGIGMSQNGANEMAKRGKDYKTILSLFYSGVKIENE